jgi:hypothetical protein
MVEPIKVAAKDAQVAVMAYLRQCNYIPQRTSELSKALNIHPSCIRRAGLTLAASGRLRADLVKGKGRGEYMFTLEQLDLFDDHKEPRRLFLVGVRAALVEIKTKFLRHVQALRGKD